MTIERCLSIKLKWWRSAIFNAKKAVILSFFIILVVFLFNFHTNFLGKYVEKNGSYFCENDEHMQTWLEVCLVF